VTADDPRPLSAEEEATWRRGYVVTEVMWYGEHVARVWATLDAERARWATLDAERARHAALEAAAQAFVDWYDGPPYVYAEPDIVATVAALRAALLPKEPT
jgi:hypothetical protein